MGTLRNKLNGTCCSLPRFVYRCAGISVNANESVAYQIYSFAAIIVIFWYPWGCLSVALNSNSDFDVSCNALFSAFGGIAVCCYVTVILCNRTRLREIFETLERFHKRYNTEKWSQQEIYNTNKKLITVIFVVCLLFLSFYVVTITERVVIADSTKWRTPISDFPIINITYSPNFEIAWTFQIFSVSIVGTFYYITGLLLVGISVDITVQFKLFRNDIIHKFNNSLKNLVQNNIVNHVEKNWLYLNSIVKEMVTRHLMLIKLAEEVEKVCSYFIIFDVMGSLGATCFGLYYASVVPPFGYKALQSDFSVLVILCSLFFICYCGNDISEVSKSIVSACYEVEFVGTDIRFQKSLLLIMMRSQRPVKLTVGGFADLSLPVYMWLLRTVYTYFMVLRESSERR